MLTSLSLTEFRNHPHAALRAGPGFVVLTGENGAGKTNILEAVSLLAPGRGLRRAPLSSIARQDGAGGFSVAAELVGDIAIGTGTLVSAPERRIVRVNGAAAPAATLAEWLTVLWLTPAMDRLFVEPASERRRFLDRLTLALAPAHAHHAARYEAAMRARNRLLADERPADPEWLSALEAQMAEHGDAIEVARRGAVDLLSQRLADTQPGPFARAALAIESEPIADLARALAEGRRRDTVAGRTLIGPHRADLAVVHRDKDQAAALCSTGEQKALLLGIVLAHADLVADRTGSPPVLLLDEVAAHLDPLRRAALFDRLSGRGQVWMTGTEAGLFDAIGAATRYVVENGSVIADA
ncbi:DNA replication/repair protein RecF [Sphingomonas japonica]|uniref:DNA replication and repair protein RecF n=1 Tax=Sphingomonas japonica TaxID=511662 RepID=A0ABX0U5J2_9SPHN|nr:DNA replication/repair protein RecF [Sphingomonas japonica]NIJ24047.1 DNA replication and repair protein RecF [Sphingomonas japonica]